MKRALIVVDVQNDFVEGGSLAVEGGKELALKIKDFLGNMWWKYSSIIATKDFHRDPGSHWSDNPDFKESWPVHCKEGTKGAYLVSPLYEHDFDVVFTKGETSAAYSGFEGIDGFGLSLEQYLNYMDITEVDICGIATDYCVKATAVDAAKLGFKTRVISDLTVEVSPDNIADAWTEMLLHGVAMIHTGVVS